MTKQTATIANYEIVLEGAELGRTFADIYRDGEFVAARRIDEGEALTDALAAWIAEFGDVKFQNPRYL